MNPEVSIIIPVYNGARYAQKVVKMIKEQTCKNFECLIIDDGSDDESYVEYSKNIANDDRFKIYTKQNGGVSSARNMGIEYASGKWISFIDCDDYIAPTYISYLLKMAEKYNADVAFCGVWKGNEDLPVIPKLKTNKIEIYSCQDALEHLLYHDGITGFAPLKVYNKRKFSDIRFNTELSVSEDLVFTWQLLKRCERVAVGNRRLYYYYQNMDSSTHGKITSDKYIHTYKYLEDYIGNTVNSLCKSLCEAYRYRMYISSINTFFKIDNTVFREKLMNYIGCNSFKILKNRRADYKVRVLAFVSYVFSTKIMLGLCELYFSKIEKICIFQRRKPV